jgi:hypothetical protein
MALADQAVRSKLVDLEFELYRRERQAPEALDAILKTDDDTWWPVIKGLGIRAKVKANIVRKETKDADLRMHRYGGSALA